MSRKANIEALFSAKPTTQLGAPNQEAPSPAPQRIRSGAIAAMGNSLNQLVEHAKLAEHVEAGSAIVDLATELLDSSFISDRLGDEQDKDIEALAASISETGQQVPILVRPHPEQNGRYQIAYGHRRVRAAQKLGVSVRAIIRTLSDADLVIAQGKENLDRRDLSFIERAYFALHLDALDFERSVIMQALSTDKADLSRYLSVAKALPQKLVRAIGPAPKVGRARWLLLAEAVQDGLSKEMDAVLASTDFLRLATDERFNRVLAAGSEVQSPKSQMAVSQLVSQETGQRIGKASCAGREIRISLDKEFDSEFASFLISQIPFLALQYTTERKEDQ